jgi:hypothetical protein
MTRNMLAAGAAVLAIVAGAFSAFSADSKGGGSVFRHVVLFKFKDSATPAQIAEVVEAFKSLKSKIDVIKDFEYGTDVSTENRAQGFTHCFFVTFQDDKGRDAYLPHPAHKAFGTLVGPVLDKVLVVDYWSKQ